MPTLEELAAFWNDEGLNHIMPHVGSEFPEGFDVRAALKNIIHSSRGILEVGCGYGRLCQAFPADKYIGVDVNPNTIKAARQKNPGYRFELITPAAQLPQAGTALLYTVALHVSDEELERFLAPICRAAPVVVISEIMDSRWRRPGNPPVFNRDPEAYILSMGHLGYGITAYSKTIYARYNTPKWNTGHDVRLTIHVYEKQRLLRPSG